MRWGVITIGLFCLHLQLFAQENEEINLIEEITANSEIAFEDESLVADLEYLLNNPFNINDTLQKPTQLFEYGLLTPYQWEQVVLYIRKYGPLQTEQELLAIPKLKSQEITRLKPYISTEETSIVTINKRGQHRLMMRDQYIFEDQKGYGLPDSVGARYVGNRHKYYLKYGYKDGRQSFGFLADKDPGEAFFKANNKTEEITRKKLDRVSYNGMAFL